MKAEAELKQVRVLACPLCGSSERTTVYQALPDYRYAVPGQYSFVQCVHCGLIYLNPCPADPSYGYPSTYSQHTPAPAPKIGGKDLIGHLKATIRKGIIWYYGYRNVTHSPMVIALGKVGSWIPPLKRRALFDFSLFPRAVPGGRLLDIGCGNGRFLAVMKMLGWEVYGIEPDPSSSCHAKDITGAVIYSTLQEAHFPDDFFDVITMNHVLEHIDSPLSVLKEVYRILRVGGKLGICVPNWKSLSHRVFQRYCYNLDPPRHVTMYEPSVLVLACKKAGFAVESIKTTSVREARVSFKRSWEYQKGSRPNRLMVKMWNIFARLMSLLDRESGEEIVLWVVK